jgi:hypothetical protein
MARGGKRGNGGKTMRGGGYVGGAASAATTTATCPAGTFCLTNTMIFFALALIIAGLLMYAILAPGQGAAAAAGPMIYQAPAAAAQRQQQHQQQPLTILNGGGGGGGGGGDSRYDRAPQPLRDWNAGPEFPPRGGLAQIPINIPTQGLPERFQSVGIMTTPDGQVLPLYGRRTATSTDRWNYYTRTDTYNPVPIPVSYMKRDCMDDVGCNELMDGEVVKNFGTNAESKVHIYRMDGPKYIPGII